MVRWSSIVVIDDEVTPDRRGRYQPISVVTVVETTALIAVVVQEGLSLGGVRCREPSVSRTGPIGSAGVASTDGMNSVFVLTA